MHCSCNLRRQHDVFGFDSRRDAHQLCRRKLRLGQSIITGLAIDLENAIIAGETLFWMCAAPILRIIEGAAGLAGDPNGAVGSPMNRIGDSFFPSQTSDNGSVAITLGRQSV